MKTKTKEGKLLGDLVADKIDALGINKAAAHIEQLTMFKCGGCKGRQKKLNEWHLKLRALKKKHGITEDD